MFYGYKFEKNNLDDYWFTDKKLIKALIVRLYPDKYFKHTLLMTNISYRIYIQIIKIINPSISVST